MRSVSPTLVIVGILLAGSDAGAESAIAPDGPPPPSCVCDDECTGQGYGSCYRGQCGDAYLGSTPCPPCDVPLHECSGGCVDIQTNVDHCGGCNRPCDVANGFACVGGSCGCPDGTECSGKCVATDYDDENCGVCANVCGEWEMCQNGACICPDDGRPVGVCNGVCVSFYFDDTNCGTCGNVCGPGEACQAGTCAYAPWVDGGTGNPPPQQDVSGGGCSVARPPIAAFGLPLLLLLLGLSRRP